MGFLKSDILADSLRLLKGGGRCTSMAALRRMLTKERAPSFYSMSHKPEANSEPDHYLNAGFVSSPGDILCDRLDMIRNESRISSGIDYLLEAVCN